LALHNYDYCDSLLQFVMTFDSVISSLVRIYP
jgi:hypothetical protein